MAARGGPCSLILRGDPVFKEYRELAEDVAPVTDGPLPLLLHLGKSQVEELVDRLVGGEVAPVLEELAQGAVQGLDRVGGVDEPSARPGGSRGRAPRAPSCCARRRRSSGTGGPTSARRPPGPPGPLPARRPCRRAAGPWPPPCGPCSSRTAGSCGSCGQCRSGPPPAGTPPRWPRESL